MPTSARSRTLAARLVVLSAAVGAVALVGFGSALAGPPPTASSTATSSEHVACDIPGCGTTTPTESTTEPTSTTPTATPTVPVTPSPGPACPGTVSTPTPKVCLPAGFGESQPAPIGTDGFVEFAAQVVNNGAPVSDASVVITLPDGLGLESDEDDPVIRVEDWWSSDSDGDGTALACSAIAPGRVGPERAGPLDGGAKVSCPTGPVAAGANFLVVIDLEALDNAVFGAPGGFTVALKSTSEPATFPSSFVSGAVDFVGTAHLQVHLTPTKASVVVGQSQTIVATIHNVGPNPAVEAAAVGFVFDDGVDEQPFLITNSEPFPEGDSGSGQASGAALARRALSARFGTARFGTARRGTARFGTARSPAGQIAPPPSPIGYWSIGTIAVGQTATVQIVVKAELVGQSELDFEAGSADESCDDGTATDCENTDAAELTAVAAATTTTTAPTTTPTTPATTVPASTSPVTAISVAGASATAAALPNTGFSPGPWLNWAAAVIALGIGLIMIGAPRRRASGRYR